MSLEQFILTANLKTLAEGLKNKEFTAAELTAAYLNRTKEKNGELKAYITVDEENALAAAKAADEKLQQGGAAPLCGIPLAVKDNICTKGLRTTCASKMLEHFVPPYNATVINRLQQQNAVILAKANMDEFAMGGSSQTSYFGGVRNPFDVTRVTGGSSGGSAAAVAAAMCPAALGSDTGGSIRQPSAFCGVTGLKPTYGTVSRYGLIAFASSLDQIGPIANSAADCALLLNAIAGPDENDATAKNQTVPDYTALIGSSLKGKTIGLPKEFFAAGLDDSVKQAVLAAAEFYKAQGCKVQEVSLPSLKYAVAAYYLISSAEAASNLSRFDGIKYGHRSGVGRTYNDLIKNSRREGFGEEVKRRIMLGNYALSSGYYDAYYNKAVQIRGKLKAEYNAILKNCDCILTPTAPTPAYKIGLQENDPVKMYSADICTVTANISGLPAISTTCGYSENGLPIGMSITGRAFAEAEIIAVADAFEKSFVSRRAEV